MEHLALTFFISTLFLFSKTLFMRYSTSICLSCLSEVHASFARSSMKRMIP